MKFAIKIYISMPIMDSMNTRMSKIHIQIFVLLLLIPMMFGCDGESVTQPEPMPNPGVPNLDLKGSWIGELTVSYQVNGESETLPISFTFGESGFSYNLGFDRSFAVVPQTPLARPVPAFGDGKYRIDEFSVTFSEVSVADQSKLSYRIEGTYELAVDGERVVLTQETSAPFAIRRVISLVSFK